MCAFILKSKPAHLPRSTAEPEERGSEAGNSYVVTNRTHPGWDFPIGETLEIRPKADGGLSWYMSSVRTNDRDTAHYRPLERDVFAQHMKEQLIQQAEPQVTVFIHGLDSLWDNAVHDTAVFGSKLRHHGDYQGLVVAFDWPSYGEIDSTLHYASSYLPNKFSGTIRDNINGSVAAFRHFLQFLRDLDADISKVRPALKINIVCHSEGNYMAMLGLAAEGVKVDQIVMLAADIDNGAFQTPSGGDVGRAAPVARSADRVTVYYSNNDETLVGSQAVFQAHHNPFYGGRLGHTGPAYNQGSQQPNMYSVDCSMVVSDGNLVVHETSLGGKEVSLHCSYLVLPQVVKDIAETLRGRPASEVVNRRETRHPNDFVMKLV